MDQTHLRGSLQGVRHQYLPRPPSGPIHTTTGPTSTVAKGAFATIRDAYNARASSAGGPSLRGRISDQPKAAGRASNRGATSESSIAKQSSPASLYAPAPPAPGSSRYAPAPPAPGSSRGNGDVRSRDLFNQTVASTPRGTPAGHTSRPAAPATQANTKAQINDSYAPAPSYQELSSRRSDGYAPAPAPDSMGGTSSTSVYAHAPTRQLPQSAGSVASAAHHYTASSSGYTALPGHLASANKQMLKDTKGAPERRMRYYAKKGRPQMAVGIFKEQVVNKRKKLSFARTSKDNDDLLVQLPPNTAGTKEIQNAMAVEMSNKMQSEGNRLLKTMHDNPGTRSTFQAARAVDKMKKTLNQSKLPVDQKNKLLSELKEIKNNLRDQGAANRQELAENSRSSRAVRQALKWARAKPPVESTPSPAVLGAIARDLALAHMGQEQGNEELVELMEYFGIQKISNAMKGKTGEAQFNAYLNEFVTKKNVTPPPATG